MTKKPKKDAPNTPKQAQAPDKTSQLEEQLKRTLADMENLRRRMGEERLEIIKRANKDLMLDLLPTLDNFDRAFQNIDDQPDNPGWLEGFQKIHQSLLDTLQKHGLQKMDSLGEQFDPEKHEALTSGAGKQDEIIEVFEEGYLLDDTVIRHAKVKIGDGSK